MKKMEGSTQPPTIGVGGTEMVGRKGLCLLCLQMGPQDPPKTIPPPRLVRAQRSLCSLEQRPEHMSGRN